MDHQMHFSEIIGAPTPLWKFSTASHIYLHFLKGKISLSLKYLGGKLLPFDMEVSNLNESELI